MAKTYRLGPLRRAVNVLTRALVATPLGPRAYVLLTVTGRKTGKRYSTPVRLMEHEGKRFLVAPYGAVGWVRNARAAGSVTLSRFGRPVPGDAAGGRDRAPWFRGRFQRRETVAVVECGTDEAARVLREYVRIEPVTRPYFDAQPGDPVERFAAEAARHPVFQVADPAAG